MDYYKIGQRVRTYRRAKGLSQEALAERAGISVTHMSHIETGNTKLSLSVFLAPVDGLGVSADSLLLPPYVRFECEAATLEPGATCDLIFRFDPAKAPERLPEQVPVILRGLGLPPVQSTVRILFGERPRPETEYMKQTEKQKRIP